jgi:hypothetical protein
MVEGSGPGSIDFPTDALPIPGESVSLPSDQSIEIYHEVLRFYRPSSGRMRLLDRALLPADSGLGREFMIDPLVAEAMVEPLGRPFCVMDSRRSCNDLTHDGLVQVSPVYRRGDERVRVVVRFTTIQPYAAAVSSTQVFLLERSRGRWTIRGRR